MANVTVERLAGRLPAEMTRFVGRRHELAEARRLLENSRLVTLAGVSGVGKTRLALRLAADLRRSFADGVWFVELSALRDAELLAHTVAEALRLPDQSARDRLDVLADFLADKHLLLVFDTCEHLVDACAMLTEVLLRAAPRLHVLATSREPLEVMGEHTMVIPPLSVPESDDLASTDEFDAVTLFADRAAAVVPGFSLADQDPRLVARLCRRLDGIPLAIELAAVRLRALSVDELLERLDDRFRLLGSARPGRSRHQTLRSAVAWSHELCTPRERLLWARLSVFPDGFDLTAAEYVCAGDVGGLGRHPDDLPPDIVFETLARLVEKSIVLRVESGRRYRMLDTIREYGAERLVESHAPEQGVGGTLGPDGLRRRHRDFYLQLALQSEAETFGAGQAERLARLAREHANLRAALSYSVTTPGEAFQAQRMAAALTHYWFSGGLLGEGRRWLGLGFEAANPTHVSEAKPTALWHGPGVEREARAMQDIRGGSHVRGDAAAAANARTAGGAILPKALCAAGLLAALQGDLPTAVAFHAEATEALAGVDDPVVATYVVELAGLIAFFLGDLERARELLVEAAGADDLWMMLRLPLLAALHCLTGELEQALACCEECRVVSEASGDRWCLAYSTWVRGLANCLVGEVEPAAADARLALRLMRDLNDRIGCAMSLDLAAGCAGFSGDHVRSARLFGAADHLWRALGAPMFFGAGYQALRHVVLGEVRVTLGERAWHTNRDEGARMTLAEAIADALGEGRQQDEDAAVNGWGPLTPRERQIAALVAEGSSNREIAQQLVIAKRTVDSHLEHILSKLGFASRTQIAAWVSERAAAE